MCTVIGYKQSLSDGKDSVCASVIVHPVARGQ